MPLIVLAVAGSVAMAGAGFLGGYTVGYVQHKPVVVFATPTPGPTSTPLATDSATPTSTPTPTPTPTPASTPTPSPNPTTVDCRFGDFPTYPGSRAVATTTQGAQAWHVYALASKVADYFASGAGQTAWQFRLTSASGSRWIFRMSHAPSCRGSLSVMTDPNGGTVYQATPDSQ
jgi:hypothetical protein